jgi:deoxycytidylate deaminase
MTKKQTMTAIIYDKRGRVLSVGQNSYIKTHPMMARHSCGNEHKVYLHAEVSAITRCRDLSRAHSIFISRYDAKGNPVCAAPCEICQSAISATPIKVIRHT